MEHLPHPRASGALVASLALVLAACAGASSPATGNGVTPSTPGSAASSGGQPGSGEEGVEGSLTTSGLYDATWIWEEGNNWGVGDIGGITLTSDQGTFGNITVKVDGSISFGSGAPELAGGSQFQGTGAQVTLSTGDVVYVCSFTLDNDLTGSDDSVIHIAGTMTFHSNDEILPC